MNHNIEAGDFAKITGDSSAHNLPNGTVVAVERIAFGAGTFYAIVQPGSLRVVLDDLERFDPLYVAPGSATEAPVVNGRPVEPEVSPLPIEDEDDDEFRRTMAELEAMFTAPPERRTEPAIRLDAPPEGQEARRPTISGEAVAAGGPEQPGREGRALPFDPQKDGLTAVDGDGDSMLVLVKAQVLPDGTLQVFVVRRTCSHGVAMPVADEARIAEFIAVRTIAYRAVYDRMRRDGLL